MIKFLEPAFLYLLIPLGILFVWWLVIAIFKIKNRPTPTYGSKYPLIGRVKFWGLFVTPALALMIMALAKPYLARNSFSLSKGVVEVGIILDRSLSMRGNDIKESRLEIAKREALNIESMLGNGDKVAFFVFGKEALSKVRITSDKRVTFESLNDISFPVPGTLKSDGLIWDSDFAGMLENVYLSFDRQDSGDHYFLKHGYVPEKRSNRIVILFSDGDDQFKHDETLSVEDRNAYLAKLNKVLFEFRRRGLRIYPVGAGTTKGVPWASLLKGYKEGYGDKDDYSSGFISQTDWSTQYSRLRKNDLLFLAKSTGADINGRVWTVENASTTVRSYLKYAIDSNRSTLPEFGKSNNDQQLWQYFLIVAMEILILGVLTHPIVGYFRKNNGA